MIRPLDEYLAHADKLAQDVINAWGLHTEAGNAKTFTPEFKALLEKTFAYRSAKSLADNHRAYNLLTEQEALEERTAREAFGTEYKRFYESHEAAS